MSSEQDKFANVSKAEGSWKRHRTFFHNSLDKNDWSKVPVKGRYRLYVSYACPWASRALAVRKLKGLESIIELTVTSYRLPNVGFSSDQSSEYKGWEFETEAKDAVFHEPHGFKTLSELYEHAYPGYTAEYTSQKQRPVYSVPVLFDQHTQKIISNESSEIIVMLNSEFNDYADNPDLDLNPDDLRDKMSQVDAIVYPSINDGVYRCGFAKTQEAYEDAYHAHWKGMDEVEKMLEDRKFLTGDRFTLSDIRLFVTLIRYDLVYYAHFKTSRNQVKEMPNLLRFLKQVYNIPGMKETVNAEHIVKHYYGSQKTINPSGIWPLGVLQQDVLEYLSA